MTSEAIEICGKTYKDNNHDPVVDAEPRDNVVFEDRCPPVNGAVVDTRRNHNSNTQIGGEHSPFLKQTSVK